MFLPSCAVTIRMQNQPKHDFDRELVDVRNTTRHARTAMRRAAFVEYRRRRQVQPGCDDALCGTWPRKPAQFCISFEDTGPGRPRRAGKCACIISAMEKRPTLWQLRSAGLMMGAVPFARLEVGPAA